MDSQKMPDSESSVFRATWSKRPPCSGLLGRIFGHHYVTDSNLDSSGLSAEQMKQVVDLVGSDGAPLLDIYTIQHFITAAEPSIGIIKLCYCTRCGRSEPVGNGNSGK